MASETDILR